MEYLRWVVSRYPGWVAGAWFLVAAVLFLVAPDLTRLAAEGQAHLVPEHSESALADALVHESWLEQWSMSLAVVALYRPDGLTDEDSQYARRLEEAFRAPAKSPETLLRVLGAGSRPEVAERLKTPDGTTETIVLQFGQAFVAPATGRDVGLFQALQREFTPPEGLNVLWTGDAVLGRDYMARVKDSLDRSAMFTVGLLMIVLLIVYRSVPLALVPLATIGVGVVVSRSVLAWMVQAGWEVSPLVELFLIVILFGCGTDFCLFLSWRFGEHWNAANPAGAMRVTLTKSVPPLLTSAGTVIAGLSLMRITEFKLFSSTGPSVAIGLALTLISCLTLTPALLVLLARWYPGAFAGLTAPPSGVWQVIARHVMKRPLLTWVLTLFVMAPLALFALLDKRPYAQDLVGELPQDTPSVRALRTITDPPGQEKRRKFRLGEIAPLTVVLDSKDDWTNSQGLAVIDDLSRMLGHQRSLAEVRSATQPLGSGELLAPARLESRLGTIEGGIGKIAEGADQLKKEMLKSLAKLKMAQRVERNTGISLLPRPRPQPKGAEGAGEPKAPDANEETVEQLRKAIDAARQLAEGAGHAQEELQVITDDPVGKRALDRLLVNSSLLEEHPELEQSFSVYISPDHHRARLDLIQTDRLFSPPALDQVEHIRARVNEYLGEEKDLKASALVTGPNAAAHDTRVVTSRDQYKTWLVVPIGVFLILLLSLRDPLACINLVVTMVLTYSFAMGLTHLVFVGLLGADGIDWKVPYFLFVLLVAVGVDYNVFLMSRMHEEVKSLGLRSGITRAVAQTGGLISSAAAITASSFASFLASPLGSIRQLGFALVVGIIIDAVLVRPVLVPCGQWLLSKPRRRQGGPTLPTATPARTPRYVGVAD
jgi:RND superfamily putative drug exporter